MTEKETSGELEKVKFPQSDRLDKNQVDKVNKYQANK